jgi:hypothetical protein
MKKFIFIISFGLVLGLLTFAQAATIAVGSAVGVPGSQVNVPVAIDDTAGKPDCSFAVSFDKTKLEYAGQTSGNMNATVLTATVSDINTAGKVQPIVRFAAGGAPTGIIVIFQFKIKSTALAGIIPLTISDIYPTGVYSGVDGSITVVETACTVTILPPAALLLEGQSQTFTATTTGPGCLTGVYTWEVSSTINSTITQNGVYTAGSTDTTVTDTITVTDTANGNITAQAKVTVNPKEYIVTINPSSVTLASGGTKQFTASTTTVNGEAVTGTYTWEISPASTIGSTISSSGFYTAGTNNSSHTLQETVVATDTAHKNASATAIVNVLPIPPTAPVPVSPEDGNTNVSTLPTFTWEAVERATSYHLTLAEDVELTEIILETDLTGTTFTPSTPLSSEPYASIYWNVTAINDGGTATSTTFIFILNVTGTQELKSEDELNHGQNISDYQMISVPLYPEDPDPKAVLGFSKCDTTVWRFFRYDSKLEDPKTGEIIEGYHEYDCKTDDPYLDFAPGRAFWLITTKKMSLNVKGTPVPTNDYFSISLQSGWNQIGNPFAFSVDWREVLVVDENGQEFLIDQQPDPPLIEFDPTANTSLWEWNGKDYDRPIIIQPWNGYWVNVLSTSDIMVKVPPTVSISSETTSPSPERAQKNINDSNFAIKLTVKGKKTRDTYNYFGISSDASLGYDRRDVFEPPQLSKKQVSLYFPHEDWKDKPGRYATDFRPLSAIDESFTFIISGGAKDEKMTLTWSGVNEVPEGYRVILLDLKKGKTVDMKKVNQYTYKADKTRERGFQVSLINNESSTLLHERSTYFMEDELDDESMEDLDLY